MTRIPVTMDETFIGDAAHKTITFGAFMNVYVNPDTGKVIIEIDSHTGCHRITCSELSRIDCKVDFEVKK